MQLILPILAYRSADILDIAERSVFGLLLWEAQDRHMAAVRLQARQKQQKIWVITPRVDVHDTLTIDPGLIDINMGYGYMCAADVTTGFPFESPPAPAVITPIGAPVTTVPDVRSPGHPGITGPPVVRSEGRVVEGPTDPALASLADAIARCRRRCWEIEHNVFGVRIDEDPFSPRSEIVPVPNPEALAELRVMKTLLGILVDARGLLSGEMPADAIMWADQWERHRWASADVPGVGNTPWLAFNSVAGTRPAETRVRSMLAKAPDRAEVFLLSPDKHWVTTPAVLATVAPGLGFAAVKIVPGEYLDAIPRGADIV